MARETSVVSAEGRAGRWAAAGAVVGFSTVAVAVTVVALALGLGAGDAVGLGAYVGIWGGTGFGFMMGGCIGLMLPTTAVDGADGDP
jgi:hypothetical protein